MTDNGRADRRTGWDDEAAADGPPARDPYLAFALRWWWLLLVGVFVGVIGAVGYVKFGPFPYATVAQVQVVPQTASVNPNAGSTQAVVATTNYAAEATSAQIFSLISQELAGTLGLSASELVTMQQEGKIDIRAVRNTNFISITVTDSDPDRARLLADTIAAVFVRDVNGRASAQIDARQRLLEQQIDATSQRYLTARLNQRLEELQRELTTQRNTLLQLQTNYQQELQRQAEQDRLAGVTGQPSPQLAATRSQWLDLISGQIADVEKGIRDLNAQVDGVRGQLTKLPGAADPSVSAVFASAYGEQLQALTRDYAQLQLDSPAARAPIVRYGNASDPLPASGMKKFLILGAGAGAALAAALGFAIDWLRRRRGATAATTTAATTTTPATGEAAAPPVAPELARAEESAPPARSEDLVYLIERARERRDLPDDEPTALPAPTALPPRRRPLPTQGDAPLRRVAD